MIKVILLCFTLAILFLSANAQITGNSIYDNAYRNYTSGNFEDAIRYYTEFISSNTNNDKAIFERGMCYESLRRFDDALRYCVNNQYKSYLMFSSIILPLFHNWDHTLYRFSIKHKLYVIVFSLQLLSLFS